MIEFAIASIGNKEYRYKMLGFSPRWQNDLWHRLELLGLDAIYTLDSTQYQASIVQEKQLDLITKLFAYHQVFLHCIE